MASLNCTGKHQSRRASNAAAPDLLCWQRCMLVKVQRARCCPSSCQLLAWQSQLLHGLSLPPPPPLLFACPAVAWTRLTLAACTHCPHQPICLSLTRVYGVHARLLCNIQDHVAPQIALTSSCWPDAEGLVCQANKLGCPVRLAEDSD